MALELNKLFSLLCEEVIKITYRWRKGKEDEAGGVRVTNDVFVCAML